MPPLPWGVLTAAALIAAWLIVAPHTPDLAGQVYRAGLFEHAGFVLWDNGWYAGHHVPGYSLTWPALASWIGVRASGALAVIASVYLFERLGRELYGPRTAAAAILFALAAAGDAWIGRLTFALGVTLALGAALAAARSLSASTRGTRAPLSRALAALLGALAAATSPVAGLLLVLAYCSFALGSAVAHEHVASEVAGVGRARMLARSFARRLRPLWPAVLTPLVVVLLLRALFPEGGFEPYAASSIAAALAVTVGFLVALPREERVLRVAAILYALVNVLALVPTPMGSNIQRYGILLAGPLLLCALFSRGGLDSSRLPRAPLLCVLAGIGLWVLWGPIVQSLGVSGDPSTRPSYYAPVVRFLDEHAAKPLRIEVPFTRAHWESAYLAPYVPLARGWERQLDKRYDLGLESHSLSASAYRAWLDDLGVSYVALPDVAFDQSSRREVQLIRGGLPYLREIFRDAHWQIFRVLRAAPLVVPLHAPSTITPAGAGARMTALGTQSFSLAVAAPGRYLVRVRYSPYWAVTSGVASISEAPGGFTELRASRPGRVTVRARFSLTGVGGAIRSAFEGA